MKSSLRFGGTSQFQEKDMTITLLVETSKLPIKELEKITELFSATLSTAFEGKTIELSHKEYRSISDLEIGRKLSILLKFSI